jgi:predicted kinase
MDATAQISKPRLIVVTGRPGSGKTTLAHSLARTVRCPVISRDEIAEGLVNTTGEIGTPGDHNQRMVYEVFFETLKLLLSRRITLVAEAAFQHKVWVPQLEPLRAIADIRIVLCQIDPQLAHSRHLARSIADPARQRFHHDRALHVSPEGHALPVGVYDPPHLDVPTLAVDTSDGYRPTIEEISVFVSQGSA